MTTVAGMSVLVPRPEGRGSTLVGLLQAAGAEPIAVPVLRIVPPTDSGPLDSAVGRLAAGAYAWIGFTAVPAVEAVIATAARLGVTPWCPASTRRAAVGPATRHALAEAVGTVDLVPARGSALELVEVWPAGHGEAVLLPQSEIAAPTLRDGLERNNYRVDAVVAYRAVRQPPPQQVQADVADGHVGAVLFTSPSSVLAITATPVHPDVLLGAIGPATARALSEAGLRVDFVADAPTDAALVAGLTACAGRARAAAREG